MLVFVSVGTVFGVSDESFKYSITPDSKDWKNYSPQELKEKLNISIAEADAMDTETLLNTVLDYPYLIDIHTYDSTIMGIEFLSKEFNGAAVLLDRNDLAENLLSNYTSSTATIVASEAEKSVGHKERIKLKCM